MAEYIAGYIIKYNLNDDDDDDQDIDQTVKTKKRPLTLAEEKTSQSSKSTVSKQASELTVSSQSSTPTVPNRQHVDVTPPPSLAQGMQAISRIGSNTAATINEVPVSRSSQSFSSAIDLTSNDVRPSVAIKHVKANFLSQLHETFETCQASMPEVTTTSKLVVNYTITATIANRQSNFYGLIVSTSSQSISSSIDLTSHASRPSAAIKQLKDRFTSQFEDQLKQFRDNINMPEVSNTITTFTTTAIYHHQYQ